MKMNLYRFVSRSGDSWFVPEATEYLAWFILSDILRVSVSRLKDADIRIELVDETKSFAEKSRSIQNLEAK